jgi:hypothetical protein
MGETNQTCQRSLVIVLVSGRAFFCVSSTGASSSSASQRQGQGSSGVEKTRVAFWDVPLFVFVVCDGACEYGL